MHQFQPLYISRYIWQVGKQQAAGCCPATTDTITSLLGWSEHPNKKPESKQ
jgi:hypothetical protein